jgi:hypothetical protein
MVQEFCDWLSTTPLSVAIQTQFWVIPTVQTIHILAIAVVVACMAMLDFRLLGLAGMRQPVVAMANRFLPWTWGALVVLLLSGVILIIGEPARELLSPVFQVKMVLLAVVVGLTCLIQRSIRRRAAFGDWRGAAARSAAIASLLLWVAIVTAGRWIAYLEHG